MTNPNKQCELRFQEGLVPGWYQANVYIYVESNDSREIISMCT